MVLISLCSAGCPATPYVVSQSGLGPMVPCSQNLNSSFVLSHHFILLANKLTESQDRFAGFAVHHNQTQLSELAWPRCLLGGVVRKDLRHAGSSSSLRLLPVAGLLVAIWGYSGQGDPDSARRARLGPTSSRLLVLRLSGASAGVREWDEGGGRGVAGGGLPGGPGAAWRLLCGLGDPPAGSARHEAWLGPNCGAGGLCIFCSILAVQILRSKADT